MSAAVSLREDFAADDLRRLARASRDAGQSRRLLALTTVYDGGSRTGAARIGADRRGSARIGADRRGSARIGADGLQTVRDWVLAFNADGRRG